MLSHGWQEAKKVLQSRECHGRCVVRKLSLAAVDSLVRVASLEAKRPGVALVMEIKVRDGEVFAVGDLAMPPTELVVIGAGLKGRTIVNRHLDVWAEDLDLGAIGISMETESIGVGGIVQRGPESKQNWELNP